MNVTKIVWQKTSDVIILLYQFSKLLREIKLQAFSVEDRDKESPVPEMLDLDIEKNDKFLNYLHMSRKSIYDAVYGSDSSDDENLQKVSDRLHGKSDDNCAGTSYVAVAETSVDEDGEIKVAFLRCQRNSAKMFKLEQNDVAYFPCEQVIKILPTPKLQKIGSRGFYCFDENMDIFEK
ncbi:hypothetical protein ACJJTC_007366 [Scirpophaga incertulas]